MGTPITGTYGSAKASNGAQHIVAEITNWSLNHVAAVRNYQSNVSAGYRRRVAGGKDITGEMTYLLDTASGARRRFEEGDSFTVIFAIDAAFAHTITVPIVIESVDNSCDIDGDGLVGGRVRFGGNGAPTFGGAFAVNQDITSST